MFRRLQPVFRTGAGIDNAAHLGGLAAGLAWAQSCGKHYVAAGDSGAPAQLRRAGTTMLLFLAGSYLRQKTGATESGGSVRDPVVALNHGNFGQAIPGLKQEAERDPDSAPTRYLLGLAYVGAHQPDAALASFQEALRLQPNYAEAEADLGMAYQAKGMPAEAEEAFRKATEFRRGSP